MALLDIASFPRLNAMGLSVVIYGLYFCFFSTLISQAEESRADQTIHPMISGYFEFELSKTINTTSHEKIAIHRKQMEEGVKNLFQDDPEKIKRYLEIEIPKGIEKTYKPTSKARGSFLFARSPKTLLQKGVLAYYDQSAGWGRGTCFLNSSEPSCVVSFSWDDQNNMGVLSRIPGNITDFESFGRLRGNLTPYLMTLQISNSQLKFADSDFMKLVLLDKIDKAITNGDQADVRIVGEIEYDQGQRAVVVEVIQNNRAILHLQCDLSRGSLFPLIKVFAEETGMLMEEYVSSDFRLHKKTGLWFPLRHVEINYSLTTGEFQERKEYTIKEATLQINQPVSQNEFAVDVTEGGILLDNRTGEQLPYKTVGKGDVKLSQIDSDLQQLSWLEKMETGDKRNYPFPNMKGLGLIRWSFVIFGLVFICIALSMKFRLFRRV